MEDRKESIKKALLTIKKECSSNKDCSKCKVLDVLGLIDCPCDVDAFPEDWEIEEHE